VAIKYGTLFSDLLSYKPPHMPAQLPFDISVSFAVGEFYENLSGKSTFGKLEKNMGHFT
jgi:hypothetical protein